MNTLTQVVVCGLLLANVPLVAFGAAPLQVQLSLTPEETLPALPVSMRLSVKNVSPSPVAVMEQVDVTVTDAAGISRTAALSWPPQSWNYGLVAPYPIDPGATLELLAPVDETFAFTMAFAADELRLWQPGDYLISLAVLTTEGEIVASNAASLRVVAGSADDVAIWLALSENGRLPIPSYWLLNQFSVIAGYPRSGYYRHLAPFALNSHLVADINQRNLDEYAARVMQGVQGLPGAYVDGARFSLAMRYRDMAGGYGVINDQVAAAAWSAKGRVYAQQLIDSPASPLGALIGTPLKQKLLTLEEWQAKFEREHDPSPPPPAGPATLNLVTVSPTLVTGGLQAAATVTLSGRAPAEGLTVMLTSSPGPASVPPSVVVVQGATFAVAPVTTSAVAEDSTVTIAARAGDVLREAFLTVAPPKLTSLTLNASRVAGGTGVTGTVTLNAAAPAGGLTVLLSSSTAAAAVPPSVSVAAGATSASFAIATSVVGTETAVTISATGAGSPQHASLTIEPPRIVGLAVDPASVTGGASAGGIVTLNGPAPAGGFELTVTSSRAEASVPPRVAIAGGARSASFVIATMSTPESVEVTITASANGVAASATLAVHLPSIALASVALSPLTVVGGLPVTGTVTLTNPAPAGGIVIALSSDDPSIADTAASVTVLAGQKTATFAVETTTILVTNGIMLSARHAGVEQSAALTVTPPPNVAALSLVVDPPNIVGGTKTNGTITLTGPAPQGGAEVILTTSNASVADVPNKVRIKKGETSDTFKISTREVSSPVEVTLTAAYGGLIQRETLVVIPETFIRLQSVTITPSVVAGGSTATGTVVLNAPPPAGGVLVSLRSKRKKVASVPASVIVPAGATTAAFPILTRQGHRDETAVIKASFAGVTKSASLSVQAQAD